MRKKKDAYALVTRMCKRCKELYKGTRGSHICDSCCKNWRGKD